MKKTKIIIPALGVMLLSTAASVTGTVAWFSMNSFVNATQMRVRAKAENGIVISNEAKSSWTNEATASHSTALEVYPTSTKNGSTWAHSTSSSASDENTGNPYTMLSSDERFLKDITGEGATGAGYLNTNGQAGFQATKVGNVEADEAYYLLNSFYLKSSAEEITKDVYVNSVTVEVTGAGNNGAAVSTELNKALRVLIVSGEAAKVFAPISGATTSYQVCTSITVTPDNPETENVDESATTYNKEAVTAVAAGTKNTLFLDDQVIPARSNENPLKIDIYLYFEGEDEACMSDNLTATLDLLDVSVQFGTDTIA